MPSEFSGKHRCETSSTPLRGFRRGGTLLWAVAALGVAAAMTPLFVSLCASLCRLTARGGYRLIATQRGTRELDRLKSAGKAASSGETAIPDLPAGRAEVTLLPGPSPALREARVIVTWEEHGVPARAQWTTFIAR